MAEYPHLLIIGSVYFGEDAHSVDVDEGLVSHRDAVGTAQNDRCPLTGVPATMEHLETSRLALQHGCHVRPRRYQLVATNPGYRRAHLALATAAGDSGDDDLVQAEGRLEHREVLYDGLAGGHVNLPVRGRVPDPLSRERVSASRNVEQQITAVRLRKRADARSLDEHLDRGNRLARLRVRDPAGHLLGVEIRPQEQDGSEYTA